MASGGPVADRLAADGAPGGGRRRRRHRRRRAAGELGEGHLALGADVADPEVVAAAVERAAVGLGGLTILVNNAGFGYGQAARPLHRRRVGPPAWQSTSPACGTASGPRRPTCGPRHGRAPARCVNVAGTAASRPTRGEGPYAAAKAGVVALTRTAALELAPEVRVNSRVARATSPPE